MEVNSPATGANQPGHGNARAVGAQPVALVGHLAAAHGVNVAAAVDTQTAFPEAEQGSGPAGERNYGGLFVDLDVLDLLAFGRLDGECQRIGC